MNDMIEKVARALCDVHYRKIGTQDGILLNQLIDNYWSKWTPDAKAAIAAMREPTEVMVGVFHSDIRIKCVPAEMTASVLNDKEVWQAMIDAALEGKV